MTENALDTIRTDGGTQPRTMINWAVVGDYSEAMLNGATFPPVTVFNDGVDYWLADGFHRLEAAKRNEAKTINAEVRQGSRLDAQWFAVGANKTHGLQRTKDDEEHAVELALKHPQSQGLNDQQVAEHCGVNRSTVYRWRQKLEAVCAVHKLDKRIGKDGKVYPTKKQPKAPAPETVDLFRQTSAADNPAEVAALTKLTPDKQLVVAEILAAGEANTVQRALRAEKERGREQTRHHNRLLVAGTPPLVHLAGQRYQTIVLDPPWEPFEPGGDNLFGRGKPTYATMSLDEIAALPVGELAADNAHCYLWITNMMLQKGFALLEQWQFRYVTTLTWCKPTIGMGYYFRNNTEHILFGVRGSLDLLNQGEPTWFQAPRTKRHSEKPDAFYDLVERCSPGPWLELFSRRERHGWVHWGAEVAPPAQPAAAEVAA
jgi:N6-adenosine-specific RNA methylase IME4/transposase-like protein